ncbi:hypothetical protein C2W64_00014 [Brevibacillus laterosporus]|nr:hypothetical protein C2W64_00014 [Brevibacillus laterosporus]
MFLSDHLKEQSVIAENKHASHTSMEAFEAEVKFYCYLYFL